jgi:transglutaminase-like putative cysteine protease
VTTPDRLTLAAAVAVALASSALTPVYRDLRWLPYVLGAVVAVASASALARLAQAPQVLQRTAGLLALAASVTLTFAGSTLLYGVVPTWTTITHLTASVASGLEDVQTLASPVPTSSQLVLLAVLGVGAIAVVVDLLAVRHRQVVVSGLPLLLLFAVPSAVQRGQLGVLPFLLGAAGWLGLLLADSSDQVRQWGPPLRGARASSSKDLSVSRSGRRIGAAALGIAALVPALVPGLDGRLVGGAGGDSAGDGARHPVTYTPMTELVGRLRETEPRQLLTYRSTAGPVHLRSWTLDVYDREQGTFASSARAVANDAVQDGVPTPAGRTAPTDAFDVEVALTKGRLGGLRLPVPATPSDIDVDGSWWWDAQAETVFSTRTTLQDIGSYKVRASRVPVDAALLRRAQVVPADIERVYAKDPELSEFAQELLDRTTEGLRNDFDRVNAVQRLLRETDFVYTEKTSPAPAGSPDDLTAFLQTRRGFCEQYAPAMAALVRGLGIPARVAMGFTGGTRIGPDQYEVTTRHAHAWPEVWFQGAGWVAFEPTPRDNDVQVEAPAYSLVPPLDAVTDGAESSSAPTAPPSAGGAGPDQRDRADSGSPSQGFQLEQDRSSWWLALAAVAALLAQPSALAAARRRWAWRSPDAHVAWRCVQDDAADLGYRWRPADSPRTAAAHLEQVRDLPHDAAEALGRIAAAVERSRYARTPPPSDMPQLRRDADTVRHALRAGVTRKHRWRVRVVPPSTLRWASTGVATALADLLDRLDAARAVGTRLRYRRRRALHRAG